ncbi:hypothetical protein R3P38DRAFT_2531662 [Favolaschia claudopus]|uniref:Uncharacterized protein n=1 Tax=Favolaschia claudopus TaxID=2862362 RepID=A0AAW0BGB4_9AGAR
MSLQAPPAYWTPQLRCYRDDEEVFTKEPIATVFSECLQARTRGRDIEYLWTRLHETLKQPAYAILLGDWLAFCLGADITSHIPSEALKECQELFLHVLYVRFQYKGQRDGEREARKILDVAQMANFHQHVEHLGSSIPADYSWEEELDSGRGAMRADVGPDDYDSEWEDVDMRSDSGEDERGNSDSEYRPEEGVSDLPAFVEEHPPPSVLPPHPKLSSGAHVTLMSLSWITTAVQHIDQFFFAASGEVDSRAVVDDLVRMRAVPSSTSGLFSAMRRVAEPGNLLETTHPEVEQSFRFHDWKLAYAELICNWIPPMISEEQYTKTLPRPDPHYRFTIGDAADLLHFICDHPEMQPWSFNPMARIDGWDTTKVYQMIMQLPVFAGDEHALADFANLSSDMRLYTIVSETGVHRRFFRKLSQELYRPSPLHTDDDLLDYDSDSAVSVGSDSDDTLSDSDDTLSDFDAAATSHARWAKPPAGKQSRSQRRKSRSHSKAAAAAAATRAQHRVQAQHAGKRMKLEVLGSSVPCISTSLAGTAREVSSSGCRHCSHLAPRKHCVRELYVKRQKWKHLLGHVITCAQPGDRLDPKPPPPPKDGSKPKRLPKVKYFHPDDLKWKTVKYRKDVFERCGKDITRLVERQSDGSTKIVGGIRYNPFSKQTLVRLVKNHRLVKVCTVRRRGVLHRWLYGSMTPLGTRQPTGGRKGDNFVAYACHRGDTPADIQALERSSTFTDALVEVGETICPGLRAEINELTQTAGLPYLGRTGLTHYTCTNYISPIHVDADHGLSDVNERRNKKDGLGALRPVAQLVKTGCGKNDFNFAYAQWGVVVRTRRNSVWLFNARHGHGTVMPGKSNMARAQSHGGHSTSTASNVIRAQRVREIRHGYNLRPYVRSPTHVSV